MSSKIIHFLIRQWETPLQVACSMEMSILNLKKITYLVRLQIHDALNHESVHDMDPPRSTRGHDHLVISFLSHSQYEYVTFNLACLSSQFLSHSLALILQSAYAGGTLPQSCPIPPQSGSGVTSRSANSKDPICRAIMHGALGCYTDFISDA
jgi:hypothetical protein